MQIEALGLTDKGKKREWNEDTISLSQDLSLFIVADGMGGHKGGKEASLISSQVVQDVVASALKNETPLSGTQLLLQALKKASNSVFQRGQNETLDLKGMGTTMVLAFFYHQRLYIANIGDSRAYLFQSNRLWQLTEDHSWVNEQIKKGVLQEKDKDLVSGKNLITRCIGLGEDVQPDILEREVKNQDRILLCSDGLTGLVSDQKIAEICQKRPLKTVAEECIEEANKAGGLDNVSVIVIDIHI